MRLISRSILYEYTPEELQKLLNVSNGYSDVLRKLGMNEKGNNPKTLKRIINEYNLNTDIFDKNRYELYKKCASNTHKKTRVNLESVLSGEHEYHSTSSLLKRLIKEGYKQAKCEICGITDWQGKPLSFHLHHKDSNNTNNRLENLQVLCPNCHSQTDSYAGKKAQTAKVERKKKIKRTKQIIKRIPPVSREELKELIRTSSFTEIGRKFNVTDNAIRKWCDKYTLPRKTSVIKTISDDDWKYI